MKPIHTSCLLVGALAAVWLAGCSTPATRIRDNPEVYARLDPNQQALVRAGQIAIGFDVDAVKLALGDPDRITQRTDADGTSEVWHYASYEAGGTVLFTGYYHSRRNWWGWGAAYPYYLNYPARSVRDRFRVQFKGGRVAVISQETGN